jgi:hypothetical protein
MKQDFFEFYMKISKGKGGIKIKAKKKTLTNSPSLKNKHRDELNKKQEKII